MRHRFERVTLAGLLVVLAAGANLATLPATASVAGSGVISRIWTDFGGAGVWDSTADAATKPNDQHHLLAFELGGTNYSTGVDDGALTTAGVAFVAGEWEALPVEGIPTSSSNIYYLSARGAGLTRSTVATPFSSTDLSAQLTRGTQGLDLASGLTNIPSGTTIEFNLPNVAAGAIGDGVPDIVVTQIASPTSAAADTLTFVDGSGNPVGNSVSIQQNTITALPAKWLPQYWAIPTGGAPPSGLASENELRLRAFELSEFGITSADVGSVAKLEWAPSGTSDPAFFAYNTASLSAVGASVSIVNPTVTLAPIADRTVADGPVATSASSSAGLTITFATADPSICTVDAGGTVTPLVVGTCAVTASTAAQTVGSVAYTAASDTESFGVLAATTPPPASAAVSDPAPSYVAPGDVLPALPPTVAELIRTDGTPVPLSVSAPEPGVLRYVGEGLEVTLRAMSASGTTEGLVADGRGVVECEVCASLAVGSVMEVWLFSSPRLVAAWEIADAPCQRFSIPLGAPLDGGGSVAPGAHTLQLVLPTTAGLAAMNVGITATGPVPEDVPSGTGASLAAPRSVFLMAGVVASSVGLFLMGARGGRRGRSERSSARY